MLFSPLKGVQFFKLGLELINKNVKVVEKSLSLKGFLSYFIYKEVVNYLYIRFILVNSYFI